MNDKTEGALVERLPLLSLTNYLDGECTCEAGGDCRFCEWIRQVSSIASERDALQARLAESEKDAGRYRVVRDRHKDFAIMQNIGHDWTRLEPQEADAAIDALQEQP